MPLVSEDVLVAYRDGSRWVRARGGSVIRIRRTPYAVLQACKEKTKRDTFVRVQVDEVLSSETIEIDALGCDQQRETIVHGTLLGAPSGTPYVWSRSESRAGGSAGFDVFAPIGRNDIVVMFGTGVGHLSSEDWAASMVSIIRDIEVGTTPTQVQVNMEQALKLQRKRIVVENVTHDEHVEVLQGLRTPGGTDAWVTIDKTAPVELVVHSPALHWAGELTTKVTAVGDGRSRTATLKEGAYVLAPPFGRVTVLSKNTHPSFGWSAYKSASRYKLSIHQFRSNSPLIWTIHIHAGSLNYGALYFELPDLSRVSGWSSDFDLIPRTQASWQLRAGEEAIRWGVWTPTPR